MSTGTEVRRSSASLESRIVDVKAKGPLVQFNSWLSKEIVDYYNTIFVAEGVRNHFERYVANPIVLWNHDTSMPGLGMCQNPQIVSREGIYLENVLLSDVPMVRDVISPLIQDGALNQMSLNAAVYKYELVPGTEILRFTDWILWEASLVNVAGNHMATITPDSIQTLRSQLGLKFSAHQPEPEELQSFEDLVLAYQRGQLVKSTGYSLGEMPVSENRGPYEVRTLSADNPQAHLVSRNLHDGSAVGLFSIGEVKSTGEVAVDRSKLSETLCRLLGAKTPEVRMMSAEVRAAALEEICKIYASQGIEVPVVRAGTVEESEMSLADLTVDHVRTLRYSDVDFKAGEDVEFLLTTLQRDLTSVTTALSSSKLPELTVEEHDGVIRAMAEVVKRYLELSYQVYGYVWGDDSIREFEEVFKAFKKAKGYEEDSEEEDDDSMEVEESVMDAVREAPEGSADPTAVVVAEIDRILKGE